MWYLKTSLDIVCRGLWPCFAGTGNNNYTFRPTSLRMKTKNYLRKYLVVVTKKKSCHYWELNPNRSASKPTGRAIPANDELHGARIQRLITVFQHPAIGPCPEPNDIPTNHHHYYRYHLWHGSPSWAIAFFRFPDNRIFTGWDCQSHAQPPTWRTRLLYLWPKETGWLSYIPIHWIPILVAFYDKHELRWDYSYPPVTAQRTPANTSTKHGYKQNGKVQPSPIRSTK
jgi:hypothetical protein